MEPFLGSAALRRGAVTRSQLRTRYRPVFRDVYILKEARLTAAVKARGVAVDRGTLAVLSVAAVHGRKWRDGTAPAEIVRGNRHGQAGIVVHSYALADGEVHMVAGMPVTTAARTGFGIGRTRPVASSVPILDALLNATGTKPADVSLVADRHPRRPWCPAAARCSAACRRWCRVTAGDQGAAAVGRCRNAKTRDPDRISGAAHSSGHGVGVSGRLWSNMTASSIGKTDISGHGTSSESRCWRLPAGPWCGSAPKCCPGRTSSSSG